MQRSEPEQIWDFQPCLTQDKSGTTVHIKQCTRVGTNPSLKGPGPNMLALAGVERDKWHGKAAGTSMLSFRIVPDIRQWTVKEMRLQCDGQRLKHAPLYSSGKEACLGGRRPKHASIISSFRHSEIHGTRIQDPIRGQGASPSKGQRPGHVFTRTETTEMTTES